jgi:acyl carrier protein
VSGTSENTTGADEVRERVREFMSRHIRRPELRDDEDIFALGFVNSLFAMQLVMFVEQEFGVAVENEDLELDNFNTAAAVAALVERKRAAG